MIHNPDDKQQLICSLVLNTFRQKKIGLMNGFMGVLITIALYSRRYNQLYLENISDEMFDIVCQRISHSHNIDFADGLSGIAWGAEYLSQAGIMSMSGEDICGSLDEIIMERNILRISDFSLETGLNGLLHYVNARLRGNLIANLPPPFDTQYLNDWKVVIDNHPDMFPVELREDFFSLIINQISNHQLSLATFIDANPSRSNLLNVSLHNGLAGYIVSHLL